MIFLLILREILKQNRWENQEGQKKSKVFIKAETVEFKGNDKKAPSEGDDLEEIDTSLDINMVAPF